MKEVCFYHSGDLDGQCSGAIVKRFRPDCEMIGIDYGEEFPWSKIDTKTHVMMVDFALQPYEQMYELEYASGRLTWIDHHKSAIEALDENGADAFAGGIRRIGIGACALTWEYFSDDDMPDFVRWLAEYDVWNHDDPNTLPFQYGMRKRVDTDPESPLWGQLLDGFLVDSIIDEGRVALQWVKTENRKIAEALSFETTLDGLNVIALNRGMTNSFALEPVFDPERHHAMLLFVYKPEGHWTVSLYSDREDVDVSEVAKARGGGGHANAAGFQCEELPFAPFNVQLGQEA